MYAHAKLHFVIIEFKRWFSGGGDGTCAKRNADRVTLIVQPAAQAGTGFKAVTTFCGCAHQFFDKHRVRHAAPTGSIEAVFDGDIIIDHHRGDFYAALVEQLGGGFKVQHITGVVFDDQQHAFATVDMHRAFKHFIRGRRGENFSRAGTTQHPHTNKPAVHWLMAASAAGKQGHFTRDGRICPGNIDRVLV
ncbi:hypothetical protein SRABI106_03807 [Rahnella aquatilis]|nr:hypothetical protein SRABI106_03807 [Rahnella aquatilis]